MKFFFSCNFFSVFCHQNPGSGLVFTIQLKMLDPTQMNADPQPWFWHLKNSFNPVAESSESESESEYEKKKKRKKKKRARTPKSESRSPVSRERSRSRYTILVQMIFPALATSRRRGEGVGTLWKSQTCNSGLPPPPPFPQTGRPGGRMFSDWSDKKLPR